MTPLRNGNDMLENAIRVGNVHDDFVLDDTPIDSSNSSNHHSLDNYLNRTPTMILLTLLSKGSRI